MKAPAAQGTVLFFVFVVTVGAQSSETTVCPNEPDWLYNGVHHYFCNVERIGQLTLQWILKSPSISSRVATCDTEKPGPCSNSHPCFQATMYQDGVSELRMASYFYNIGDVECHGTRESNDLCKFTLSYRRDQEEPFFLSTRSMCNLPVSTAVPNVDRTFIQKMLKPTTKVVSDRDAPSSSHTTMNVNQAFVSVTTINLDLTSVQSMRNESTRKDTTETASSSTSHPFLTKPPSKNKRIINNFTTQKSMQGLVSTNISHQNRSVNYQQKKSAPHNFTKVTQIIVSTSVISFDPTSVRILRDETTERVTTTKATTTMNGDLQSIAIGATAAFVATVCVTGMILISLYRRSRKSCTHTNILKQREDKTPKHFGKENGWVGNSSTSTSTCVCLSEIEFPTSLATDSSCFANKKLTTDLVEMFNPVYSSSNLASEMLSETERSNP